MVPLKMVGISIFLINLERKSIPIKSKLVKIFMGTMKYLILYLYYLNIFSMD